MAERAVVDPSTVYKATDGSKFTRRQHTEQRHGEITLPTRNATRLTELKRKVKGMAFTALEKIGIPTHRTHAYRAEVKQRAEATLRRMDERATEGAVERDEEALLSNPDPLINPQVNPALEPHDWSNGGAYDETAPKDPTQEQFSELDIDPKIQAAREPHLKAVKSEPTS